MNKFYYLPLIVLVTLSIGCQKSKQSNPCEGVVSEGMPMMAGLILIDKQTGGNILLSENIDSAAITITQEGTNVPSEQAMIVKNPGSPMYGAMVFHIADTKKGAFKYKINIPDVGSTTLSYTNTEEESDNACNPHYISVNDPVIEDHEFTLTRTGSRLMFKITL